MKRFLIILLTLIMVLCVTACGKDDNVRGSYEGGTPGATQAPASTDNSFAIGGVQANKYVNTFVGLSCTLGSEWTYMTDAEIRQNNEAALGMLGDDYAEAIQNATTFTDMMAVHQNQTDTVSITFEKLTGTGLLMTEEQYANASSDALKGALSSMGIDNVTTSIGKMTFAGKEHAYIDVSGIGYGIPVFERLVLVKCSNYMVSVATCTWQNNTCTDILAKFQAE